ncbi:uncharacterized protein LOC122642306 [Telopea speciosissima]|uniref:uncharacterized protein LOC122642306 n=1 Tax=Telopea speciosissima TaxID=54955 RepID=UPI001CC6906D|nr:uncharacterized protein LOC122642306 [Telopea speciosissima]
MVGFIKVNCDAALTVDLSKGGLGVIFRDHIGAVVKAGSIPQKLGSVIQGEIMAIRSAFIYALELSFDYLIVESDSRDAIAFCDGSKSPRWEVEDLVADVVRLKSSFSSISFSFIPRVMNGIPDALARKALSIGCIANWPNSIQWLQELCVTEATDCTHPSHQ